MQKTPSLQNAYDLKSPDDNVELYSAWAETYDNDFIEDMQYKLHFSVAEEFVLNGGKGLILDVGAGTGALAQALLLKGKFSIDATDISKEMLKVADSKNVLLTKRSSVLGKESIFLLIEKSIKISLNDKASELLFNSLKYEYSIFK